ncbi:MAG: hypothetical protein LAT81_12850 [Oceanicaulis sp.]|nr:hypothetical protein [Oceanicaulis sp.]
MSSAILEARHDLLERADPTEAFLDYIHAQGLDLDVIARFAGIGALSEIIACGNRFDFAPAGHDEAVMGFVIEAFAEDDETVIDLVAWAIERPNEPLSMFGTIGLLGVANAVNPASYFLDEPLRIARSPLRWLQSGGRGACVIDRRRAASELIDATGLGRIAGEDFRHTKHLLRLAESVVDRSRFVSPTPVREAA